jgi:hypothetical protein
MVCPEEAGIGAEPPSMAEGAVATQPPTVRPRAVELGGADRPDAGLVQQGGNLLLHELLELGFEGARAGRPLRRHRHHCLPCCVRHPRHRKPPTRRRSTTPTVPFRTLRPSRTAPVRSQLGQRRIPHLSRRSPPEPPVHARESRTERVEKPALAGNPRLSPLSP